MLRVFSLLEQSLELSDGVLVLPIELQCSLEFLEGSVHVELAARRQSRNLDVGPCRVAVLAREFALVEADQVVPLLLIGVQVLERRDGGIFQAQVQDGLVDLDGAGLVFQHFCQQAGAPVEKLLLLVLRLGHVHAALQDFEQRLGIARFLVERLERRQGGWLVRTEVERLPVVLAREVAIGQAMAAELGDSERDGELQLAVEQAGHDLAEQAHLFCLATGGLSQPFGMLQPGLRVDVAHRFAQPAFGVLERAGPVAQRRFGHLEGEFEPR